MEDEVGVVFIGGFDFEGVFVTDLFCLGEVGVVSVGVLDR